MSALTSEKSFRSPFNTVSRCVSRRSWSSVRCAFWVSAPSMRFMSSLFEYIWNYFFANEGQPQRALRPAAKMDDVRSAGPEP